jgi:hypothetical protein
MTISASTFWQTIELAAASLGVVIDADLDGALRELRAAGAIIKFDPDADCWQATLPADRVVRYDHQGRTA